MKYFFTIVVFFITTITFAQEKKNLIVYNADSIYMTFFKGDKVVTSKPYGQSVIISYDKFFKSYEVSFLNENGKRTVFNYKYIQDEKDWKRMKDEKGNIYLISDDVISKGTFIIKIEKEVNGLTGVLITNDASISIN